MFNEKINEFKLKFDLDDESTDFIYKHISSIKHNFNYEIKRNKNINLFKIDQKTKFDNLYLFSLYMNKKNISQISKKEFEKEFPTFCRNNRFKNYKPALKAEKQICSQILSFASETKIINLNKNIIEINNKKIINLLSEKSKGHAYSFLFILHYIESIFNFIFNNESDHIIWNKFLQEIEKNSKKENVQIFLFENVVPKLFFNFNSNKVENIKRIVVNYYNPIYLLFHNNEKNFFDAIYSKINNKNKEYNFLKNTVLLSDELNNFKEIVTLIKTTSNDFFYTNDEINDRKYLIKKNNNYKTISSHYVNCRQNQNLFRGDVLTKWKNKCSVTNIEKTELLIASHIVAWSDNESERLNSNNGIPLIPNLDKLFDAHLISFDENFSLVINEKFLDKLSDNEFSWLFTKDINKKNYNEIKLKLENFDSTEENVKELKMFLSLHYKEFKQQQN